MTCSAALDEGLYLFATDLWRLEGIRKLVTIRHAVICADTGVVLSEDASQRLVEAAAEHGHPIDFRMFADAHECLVETLATSESDLVDRFLQEADAFASENATRVEQAKQLLQARADRIIGKLQTILAHQLSYTDERRRRIVRVTEGRLRNAAEDRDRQLARIERQGQVAHSRRPVAGGLIAVRDPAQLETTAVEARVRANPTVPSRIMPRNTQRDVAQGIGHQSHPAKCCASSLAFRWPKA